MFHKILIFSTLSVALNASAVKFTKEYKTSFDINDLRTSSSKTDIGKASHLKYFGYFWNGVREKTWSVGPDFYEQSSTTVDYIDEVKDHSNLTWISMKNGYYKDTTRQLKLAKKYGMKAVLDIVGIVMVDPKKPGGLSIRRDYENIETELREEWKKRVVDHGLEDTVITLYPMDEPYKRLRELAKTELKGANKQKSSHMQRELDKLFRKDKTLAAMKLITDHLDRINTVAKKVTGKKTAVFLHPTIANKTEIPLPPSYDWIGFSCYTGPARCGGQKKSMTELMSRLLQRMQPHQKFMYAAEAFQQFIRHPKDVTSVNDLNHRMKIAYEIALNEPRFVAFIPFIWRSYKGGGKDISRGARDIPEIIPTLKEIGMQIIYDQKIMPSSRYADRYSADGNVENKTADGLIGGWAIDYDVPHLPSDLLIEVDGDIVEELSTEAQGFAVDAHTNKHLKTVGRHLFEYELPESLKDRRSHTVKVIALNYHDSSRKNKVIGHFSVRWSGSRWVYGK